MAHCSFFEANMCAALACVAHHCGGHLKFNNVQSKVESILCKNKFLPRFGYAPQSDLNGTVIPFSQYSRNFDDKAYQHLELLLQPNTFHAVTAELKKELYRHLLEVYCNAAIHSGDNDVPVFLCGQYYPYKNVLIFTIADPGIGIPANVSDFRMKMQGEFIRFSNGQTGRRIKLFDDTESVKWAMTGRNSTKPDLGGIGLKTTRDFVVANGGKLTIVSGDCFVQFSGTTEDYRTMNGKFYGTCVSIEIKTNRF